MFQQNMTENLKNRVDLKDIEPEVFEELLKYIYTGIVTKLQNMASDLLDAAFKVCWAYYLKLIKFICKINNILVRASPP